MTTRAEETARLRELKQRAEASSVAEQAARTDWGAMRIAYERYQEVAAAETEAHRQYGRALRNAALGLLEDRERLQRMDDEYHAVRKAYETAIPHSRQWHVLGNVLALLRPSGATGEERG